METKPLSRKTGNEYQRITDAVQQKFEGDFEYILGARNRTRDYLIPLLEFYYFTYTAQAALQLNRFLDGERNKCVPLYFCLEWEKTSQNRHCFSEGWNTLQDAVKRIFAHAITLEILNQTEDGVGPVDYIKLQELINCAPGEDHRIAEQIKVLTDCYRKAISDCPEMAELSRSDSPDSETAAEIRFLFESVRLQFENTDRNRPYTSYAEKFEKYSTKYLKRRGRSGMMLNLSEETLILLTKVCIKDHEKMRLNDVFSEFEARGVFLDNYSKSEVMHYYEKLNFDERTVSMSPLHPLNILYQLTLLEEKGVGEIRDNLVEKLSPLYLLPYIRDTDKTLYHAIEQQHSPEWRIYAQLANKRYQGARNYVQKLVCDKISQYIDHFTFLFDDLGNDMFCINLVNMGDCREVLQGLIRFYAKELKEGIAPENLKHFTLNIYSQAGDYNEFTVLSDQKKLREYISVHGKDVEDIGEMALVLSKNIRCYYRNSKENEYRYSHVTFYEMESSEDSGDNRMDSITTGVALGGLTSGTPSVLSSGWYKTGFGTKYVAENRMIQLAKTYNAMFRVAFSGSSYEPESAIFTEISSGEEGQLGKIYSSSNWVVFVNPKVDLSFFKENDENSQELMIIHYSDQYTSTSGYDDITVTQKSEQYEEIIQEQLTQKGVRAQKADVHNIISLFNAINGGWLLRLISAKKLTGAVDSNFSREKMSILSAVKLCMAYYSHKDIIWIPISLEEMLRVSGGAGYSQKDGLLSAKNLGFEKGATSDDLLMVGIEGPADDIKVYLHPVEVKIGLNQSVVISKAKDQVLATYAGLWKALCPETGYDSLECKLSRNFLMQVVVVCCEKMKLYNVYPDEQWNWVLEDYREALMNEQYRFSTEMDILQKEVVRRKPHFLIRI